MNKFFFFIILTVAFFGNAFAADNEGPSDEVCASMLAPVVSFHEMSLVVKMREAQSGPKRKAAILKLNLLYPYRSVLEMSGGSQSIGSAVLSLQKEFTESLAAIEAPVFLSAPKFSEIAGGREAFIERAKLLIETADKMFIVLGYWSRIGAIAENETFPDYWLKRIKILSDRTKELRGQARMGERQSTLFDQLSTTEANLSFGRLKWWSEEQINKLINRREKEAEAARSAQAPKPDPQATRAIEASRRRSNFQVIDGDKKE